MKKRTLFVFAGQSNMMGAGVFPPAEHIEVQDSYEYVHKAVRMGAAHGDFRPAGFPCGEFAYTDLQAAYPQGAEPHVLSTLAEYAQNAWFSASMSNLVDAQACTEAPFSTFSEASFTPAPALPPYFAQTWERRGHSCAYAHIAKGSTSILHYFSDDMLAACRASLEAKCRARGIPVPAVRELTDMQRGAAAYFVRKTADFFRDSRERFPQDDLSDRCLVWLQGESDKTCQTLEYETMLETLWHTCRHKLGFTHFLCIRVGYFGDERIPAIMKAQENFCAAQPDAWMMTRACSMMPWAGQDQDSWFVRRPEECYQNCRDSFAGFHNQHINEKGFLLIAERMAARLEAVLEHRSLPELEEELVRAMI